MAELTDVTAVTCPQYCDLPTNTPQGPGYACLERLLKGAHRQWPSSCDEPPEGGPEALAAGVAAGLTTASGDLSDVADTRSSGRHKSLSDEALDGGPGLSGGDDDGRLWLVGDRISIADIVVTDLVSGLVTWTTRKQGKVGLLACVNCYDSDMQGPV